MSNTPADHVPSRRRSPRRISIEDGPPSLLYTVKQVELAIRHHLDSLLQPAGITALQYTALTVLQRRDGLTLTDLARNSFVTVQSMADLVRSLLHRGLISRRPDPGHGRRQLVSLTPAGHALLTQYEPKVRNLEKTMLAPLTETEVQHLRQLLRQCRSALS